MCQIDASQATNQLASFIDGGAEVGSKEGLSFLPLFEALFVVMSWTEPSIPLFSKVLLLK